MNDLSNGVSSTCKAFADEISLFYFVNDKHISRDELNSELKKVSDWKIKFNPDPVT